MRIAPVILLVFVSACTKASYTVAQPPAAGMLEQYKEIVVERVQTASWMEDHPRISQNPAYAEWRSSIGVAADQIPATAKKYLKAYYEIRGEAGSGTLIVKSELLDFNAGSGDAYGEGNARVKVKVTLHDPDGKEFGSAEVEGIVKSGSVEKAYDVCGHQVAKFIIDHRPKEDSGQ